MSLNFFSTSSYFLSKNKKKAGIISTILFSILFSTQSFATINADAQGNKNKLNLAHIEALMEYHNENSIDSLLHKKSLMTPYNLKQIIKDNKEGRLTYKQRLIAEHISDKYAKLDIKTANKIVQQAYIKAEKHNIDPEILLAIAGVESNYNPKIVNRIGASGLTQIVKRYHQDKIKKVTAKGGNILTIEDNLDIGAEIYSILYKKYGNHTMALQAYNGSQKDKTKKYSKKVMRELQGIKLSYKK